MPQLSTLKLEMAVAICARSREMMMSRSEKLFNDVKTILMSEQCVTQGCCSVFRVEHLVSSINYYYYTGTL